MLAKIALVIILRASEAAKQLLFLAAYVRVCICTTINKYCSEIDAAWREYVAVPLASGYRSVTFDLDF